MCVYYIKHTILYYIMIRHIPQNTSRAAPSTSRAGTRFRRRRGTTSSAAQL